MFSHEEIEEGAALVTYRDNPTFTLAIGCLLTVIGIADVALAVSGKQLSVFRLLLGICFGGWGASLLWRRFR